MKKKGVFKQLRLSKTKKLMDMVYMLAKMSINMANVVASFNICVLLENRIIYVRFSEAKENII